VRKISFIAAFIAAAVVSTMLIAPTSAGQRSAQVTAAAATNTFDDIFIRGQSDSGERFRGRLDVRRFFVNDAGDLRGVGIVNGKVRNSSGEVIQTVTDKRVRFPVGVPTGVSIQQASCEILHLEIGPIDLDLLGLVIHVDKIVIDITAEPGPGNLLGNLLCAIAHLLDDPPGTLNRILADLLNLLRQLLRLFG
jgi:hypothetical protein